MDFPSPVDVNSKANNHLGRNDPVSWTAVKQIAVHLGESFRVGFLLIDPRVKR